MLYGRHMLPTIPASDLARARAWYADKLGFTGPPAPNSPPGSGLANRKCGTTGSQRRGATGQRWPASAP